MDTDDNSKWERIRELEELLVTSQDACEKAIEAGQQYKVAADEGAKRTEEAERRVYELTKNRELFQEQRDVAIRERDRARDLCDRVMKTQELAINIERLALQPGDLVILRVQSEAQQHDLEALSKSLKWIQRTYPGNTFLAFAKGIEFDIETMSETDLRARGLILACRVDAGVQQLEAAFGTHQAALRLVKDYLTGMITDPDIDEAWGEKPKQLLQQIEAILRVELVRETPEAKELDYDGERGA